MQSMSAKLPNENVPYVSVLHKNTRTHKKISGKYLMTIGWIK